GGPVLIPGDATYYIQAGNDLVIGGVGDAGRVQPVGIETIHGLPLNDVWFSLWTDNTAIDLFAAGGDLTPGAALGQSDENGRFDPGFNYVPDGVRFSYPSILRASAANGNIYLGASAWVTGGAAVGYGRAEN